MAKRKVKWTLRAINDKLSIYAYWTKRNHSTAYAIKLERLFKSVLLQVADYPLLGRNTDEEGVRVSTVSHYNLFYSYDEDNVNVLTVFDTRRDEKKRRL